jgi:hypothetical protein
MKVSKIIVLFILNLFTVGVIAQNCGETYYFAKEGAKATYEHYDSKNKLTQTQENVLKTIRNTATGFEILMSTSLKDAKGKVLFDNRNFNVKCDNGVLKMDLSSMYMGDLKNMGKDIVMEVSGDGVSFPSELKEGADLPNGETEVKMKSGSMTLMTLRFNEMNRKVEKKESVTTPAGTFDCYKIVSDTEMKILIKRNIKTASWIARGVGVVKTESYNKKGEIESTMVLTKLEK